MVKVGDIVRHHDMPGAGKVIELPGRWAIVEYTETTVFNGTLAKRIATAAFLEEELEVVNGNVSEKI